ncbi:Predicted Fe-S protein YdhL, DUF1289 family [Caballeronia arationis]|uniref:Predicted Fe-S protein YdhL, DUF1289 family n=1 Tax=Caballeronia arationis TaxID=1777142 RepID=A0A7Z7N6T1_9BURK|nr:Predicted Fe-S protein YdhL, DUF1289 family [Caballeronia arationis]
MNAANPCVGKCEIDTKSGLCIGCYRTAEEIRGWMNYSGRRRQSIIRKRVAREKRISIALTRRGSS